MYERGPAHDCGNPTETQAQAHLPLERFLRPNSAWPFRAWVFFGCALVFCTAQSLPSWTHPDLYLGLDRSICYAIITVAGAIAGFIAARYPALGSVAGALAGSGSLMAAVFTLDGVAELTRLLVVVVEMIGLLPGIAFYCVAHLVVERLTDRAR